MRFFRCLVCAEKDQRIEDLKNMLDVQTELLRQALKKEDSYYSKAVTLQANRALDGANTETFDLSDNEELMLAEKQAIAMLNGTY